MMIMITTWKALKHLQTIPPTPVRGGIVFLETGPWYQKGWALLP